MHTNLNRAVFAVAQEAVNSGDNSNLVMVPSGTILSDSLYSTPLFQGEGRGFGGGGGEGAAGGEGQDVSPSTTSRFPTQAHVADMAQPWKAVEAEQREVHIRGCWLIHCCCVFMFSGFQLWRGPISRSGACACAAGVPGGRAGQAGGCPTGCWRISSQH